MRLPVSIQKLNRYILTPVCGLSEFLDSYLNGPRTLSDQRLSSLVLTTPSPSMSDSSTVQSYDLFLFSTHFLGDGMALHTTMNEVLLLLAADGDANLDRVREARGGEEDEKSGREPRKMAEPMESQLVTPEKWGRMAWAGARVEFQRKQAKLVVSLLLVPSPANQLLITLEHGSTGRARFPSHLPRSASHRRPNDLVRQRDDEADPRDL